MIKLQLILIACSLLIENVYSYPKSEKEYINEVEKMIDEYASYYNIGFSFGIVHKNMNHSYAAGPNDYINNIPLKPEDKIPLGSFTKTFTAMTILRYIEEGKMSFNDTISSKCDDWLKKTNGTTLLEIFQGDETILNVTLWHLLSMTSGLKDYKDVPTYINQVEYPNKYENPIDFMYELGHFENKFWA